MCFFHSILVVVAIFHIGTIFITHPKKKGRTKSGNWDFVFICGSVFESCFYGYPCTGLATFINIYYIYNCTAKKPLKQKKKEGREIKIPFNFVNEDIKTDFAPTV